MLHTLKACQARVEFCYAYNYITLYQLDYMSSLCVAKATQIKFSINYIIKE